MGTSNVYITHRCDLRCPYCFENRREDDIEPLTLLAALEFLFRWDPDGAHYLFGGEPFLRPDLVELAARWAKDRRHFLAVMTHGRLLFPDVLRRLSPYNNSLGLVISVDSTGEPKDWRMAEPFIRAAQDAGFSITLQYTVHPGNIERILKTGQSLLNFAGPRCFINLRKICESWRFSTEDLRILKEQCLELHEMALRQNLSLGLPCKITGREPLDKTPCCSTRMASGEVLTVDTDGKIYDCECFLETRQNCLGDIDKGLTRKSALPQIPLTPTSCHFHGYGGNEQMNQTAFALDRIIRRRTRAVTFLKG